MPLDELQELWLEPSEEAIEVEIERLQEDARSLDKTLRRRNLIEQGAGILVFVLFGGAALTETQPLAVAGNALVAAGALLVTAILYRKGRAEVPPDVDSSTDFLERYRTELEHQARLLRWVPVWYLGPLFPGALLLAIEMLNAPRLSFEFVLTYFVMVGLFLVGVVALNLRASAQMKRQAEALPRWDDAT